MRAVQGNGAVCTECNWFTPRIPFRLAIDFSFAFHHTIPTTIIGIDLEANRTEIWWPDVYYLPHEHIFHPSQNTSPESKKKSKFLQKMN